MKVIIALMFITIGCSNSIDGDTQDLQNKANVDTNNFANPQVEFEQFNLADSMNFEEFFDMINKNEEISSQHIEFFIGETDITNSINRGRYAKKFDHYSLIGLDINGSIRGEFVLLTFNLENDVVDKIIIDKYCYESCEIEGLRREVFPKFSKEEFRFEIWDFIQNDRAKTRILETNVRKKENWSVDNSGHFIKGN